MPTCTRVHERAYTCSRVGGQIPRLSNRSLGAVRDSSREFLLFSVLLYMYNTCIHRHTYRLFPEHVYGRFSSGWHAMQIERQTKKERGRKERIFVSKQQRVLSYPLCTRASRKRSLWGGLANDREEKKCPVMRFTLHLQA